ncbi:MAG: phage BR0599 family protein [Alphaproteobacteria bacterium]|nr:phage BR0599 family protein [Alphaproteobacteria bacterium]
MWQKSGNNIVIGNTFNAIAGCDKTIGACSTLFNNAVNFHGEPYVPGMDKMLSTAATSNDLQHS